MQRIIPHLWFDKEAKEATAFYAALFPDSAVTSVNTIKDTPSGDCDMVSFKLAGQDFMAISAGPMFKLNPSISLFAVFGSVAEIDAVWQKLSEGAQVLMPYNSYPWAEKYGWLQDRHGLSWQLSLSENHKLEQPITPMLMFTQGVAGRTQAAMEKYAGLFPDSSIDMAVHYGPGEGDKEEYLKHARFRLAGQHFMAMDSSQGHQFTFNEAFSLIVRCETQEEIDRYWSALSAVPAAEQCGWLKDEFGVSWQIVPTAMDRMMASADAAQKARVTQAFLKMKKFDIAALESAYQGS